LRGKQLLVPVLIGIIVFALCWRSSIASTPVVVPDPPGLDRLRRVVEPKFPGAKSARENPTNCALISTRYGRPELTGVSGRYCIRESPPPEPSSEDIWPEFIGIGPARSGSTVLMMTLAAHPQVQVGDPALNNQTCCDGSELYFFEHDDKFIKGLDYYKGFFGSRKPGVRIAGEKTPRYSDHPLVPYRIRSMLGPKMKFVFTVRDPLEALISLFYYRKKTAAEEEHGQSFDSDVSFKDYAESLLDVQVAYSHCIDEKTHVALDTLGAVGKGIYMTIFEAFQTMDLGFEHAQQLDEAAYSCWIGSTGNYTDDRLQHYYFVDNLTRWRLVFGDENVMCVWNDEFRRDGLTVSNRVASFLGLDPFDDLPEVAKPNTVKKNSQTTSTGAASRVGAIRDAMGHAQFRQLCHLLYQKNKDILEYCPRMFDEPLAWCGGYLNS